jgi:hypothetical protein
MESMAPFCSVKWNLQIGRPPEAYRASDAKDFLDAYVQTSLREEIQQEGLARNMSAVPRSDVVFARCAAQLIVNCPNESTERFDLAARWTSIRKLMAQR